MNDIERKTEFSRLMGKRREKETAVHTKDIGVTLPTPWYKRPLEKGEFTHRLAKNGRYYVRHKEWSERVWIGPYKNLDDVEAIVDSYIVQSLSSSLDKVGSNSSTVHSVVIDNPEDFF